MLRLEKLCLNEQRWTYFGHSHMKSPKKRWKTYFNKQQAKMMGNREWSEERAERWATGVRHQARSRREWARAAALSGSAAWVYDKAVPWDKESAGINERPRYDIPPAYSRCFYLELVRVCNYVKRRVRRWWRLSRRRCELYCEIFVKQKNRSEGSLHINH